jgi:hypothetical protein
MYIKFKQKILIGIMIILVICLIFSGIYIAEFIQDEKVEKEDEPVQEFQYDPDKISPFTNQGLILEIERIRCRRLLDLMMQRGSSWKTPPNFYFITIIDDQEYVSKDVHAAGASSEQFFDTWDTMFLENKINRNVEEEQETSEVELIIMEQVKQGIFGLRKNNIEMERIQVTYDFRTGRWHGASDSFNDSDGYGHYVGENYEIWFNIYQTDKDGDRIPYWTEVNILNTSPEIDDTHLDPDKDGIPTIWEWKWGYNPHKFDNHSTLDPEQDGLDNIEEYKMEKYFADPVKQDIFIESDGMEKGGLFDWNHYFWLESQQVVIERFAQHGINVYIDAGWPGGPVNGGGEKLKYYETISQDSGMVLQFYRHHFSDERKGIFRYLIIGKNAGFCHPAEFNRYDTMALGTNRIKYMMNRLAFTTRKQRLALAAGVMHELGHSLGIGPWNVGGNDNLSYIEGRAAKNVYLEKWGDYKSVMNYYYIWKYDIVDYSDGSHGPNDVNDWELFDLTAFQKETNVIEDPGFELPGEPEI